MHDFLINAHLICMVSYLDMTVTSPKRLVISVITGINLLASRQ